MVNAVIASLEENLKNIKIVAEPTHQTFTSDKGNTADKRELTVQEFISSYLTSDYQIKKGNIFSKNQTSKNIDCVVLFPNHPKLKTPIREVIIAEGVYAAIEVKPDISTLTENSEFHRGLLQIQSVKRIERSVLISGPIDPSQIGRQKYFNKIPSILFSFKSQKLINVVEYIKEIVQKGIISDEEIPDIIISIDKGILFYCPYIKETIFKNYLDGLFSSYPDKVFIEIPELESKLLIWFLRLFLALPKPSLTLSKSILFDYLTIENGSNATLHSLYSSDNFVKNNLVE